MSRKNLSSRERWNRWWYRAGVETMVVITYGLIAGTLFYPGCN